MRRTPSGRLVRFLFGGRPLAGTVTLQRLEDYRMRIVANSIPKSGTNLLARLLTLIGFEQTSEMGIRSRLVAGPFSPARKLLRARSAEKVTIGVASPQRIDRRWLERRLSRVADGYFVTAHCVYSPELASLFAGERMRVVCILRDPRDVAVSQMHHIKQRKRHPIHDAFVALPSDMRVSWSLSAGVCWACASCSR